MCMYLSLMNQNVFHEHNTDVKHNSWDHVPAIHQNINKKNPPQLRGQPTFNYRKKKQMFTCPDNFMKQKKELKQENLNILRGLITKLLFKTSHQKGVFTDHKAKSDT